MVKFQPLFLKKSFINDVDCWMRVTNEIKNNRFGGFSKDAVQSFSFPQTVK